MYVPHEELRLAGLVHELVLRLHYRLLLEVVLLCQLHVLVPHSLC